MYALDAYTELQRQGQNAKGIKGKRVNRVTLSGITAGMDTAIVAYPSHSATIKIRTPVCLVTRIRSRPYILYVRFR